jgi:hypothetical protein
VDTLGLVGMLSIHQWYFAGLILWFLWVGTFADRMNVVFRNPSRLREVNWHLALFNTVGTLTFFALAFYPKLKPSLGGGQPTKVILQFVTTSPIDHASRSQVWLVDEVDSGYYVLSDEHDHKAVFLTKSLVSAIFFDAGQ